MNVLSSAAKIEGCSHHHFHTYTHTYTQWEGGAGVFKYPIVPLRAASSDGHMMGLDKELI